MATTKEVDLVIGADGLHSQVREILLGAKAPVATGGSPIARHFPLPYCAIRSANAPSGGARTGIS
jgi:2-polyprenyl-6-methoxyphenol hydroxylase-like FAD-dependent oxidoreductase